MADRKPQIASRKSQILFLAAVLALGGRAYPADAPLRLDYDLRVWKGLHALGRTIGSVTMALAAERFEGRPCRVLRVRTVASAVGFDLDATTESYMAPDLGREFGFHYTRTGSPKVQSSLVFGPDQIEYRRRVGGEWRALCRHPYDATACDMFAALYLARADGLAVGGPPRVARCVADQKLWDIAFRAVAHERVEVPAGTFDTVRVELAPEPANAYTRTQPFRGPFALGPDLTLWIEPARRLVVKLAGTAHLSVSLQAEMALRQMTNDPGGMTNDRMTNDE